MSVPQRRKARFFAHLFLALFLFSFPEFSSAQSPVTVNVSQQTGNYSISSNVLHWQFSGTIGQKLSSIKSSKGHDAIGDFQSIYFTWKNKDQYAATIRWYDQKPVIIFSLSLPDGAENPIVSFPEFNAIPASLFHFSYRNDVFSAPEFSLTETSTPWLFFDKNKNACVISPASDFIVSKLTGDGKTRISSGLNEEIKKLPKSFTHSTIIVFNKGIETTWNTWGDAMRKLYNRTRPENDADVVLKSFGYWTDNGADYYYNYDTAKGYETTLLDLRKVYKKENIPLGYMQLDSWWYEKSIYDPDGKPDADHKNKALPKGEWNRYGGLLEYIADPFLFPDGLASFHEKIALPLVTHNRWIDPQSPYHKKYKISGYAAIDPHFWNDIMHYLKTSGVVCYEQDWLNYIYNKSPEMLANIEIGNQFTDGMANAAKANGLHLQYCMAMPRFFLQGLKYNNLTTIRTSDDRFEPRKWMPFIFTSQFAYEMGIWPWCDVFKSSETGNMIVSVLSAGAVGTGDAIGKEDKKNIMLACRNDGVLVKPDVPLLPLDEDYLQIANQENKPLLASTFTKHSNVTTHYLFAFSDQKTTDNHFDFRPSALGMSGKIVVYDPMNHELKVMNSKETFSGTLLEKYGYYIIAPVNFGIAFLGDENKIAATGKKRIAELNSSANNLKVKILFAKGEKEITLCGYYENTVSADKGKLSADPQKHFFTLQLTSDGNGGTVEVNLKK
ncbi:MAG TPA: hypothetical protein VN722_04830 [Hanamia sp.]|nr:hypothetical protein [Hanamia sp.]